MGKLKFLYFLAITVIIISVQVAFSSLSQKVQAKEANNVQASAAANYFLIGKNNFEDKTIDKGELDQVIGTGKMTAPRDVNDSKITYNEFYMKYNFSPEMANYNSDRYQLNPYNYTRYMERTSAYQNPNIVLKQYDLNGDLKTDNGVALEYFTTTAANRFMAGSNVPQTPKSFLPTSGSIPIKPLFFSYLYVGDGVENQNNSYKYNTKILFEDALNYSEDNKVSDYMLTDKNKFVIPTRYNTERDDLTLLMRSKTEVNTNRPNVYLDVKDEKNASVVGKTANSKYFINANVSLHLTPFAYNILRDDNSRATYKSLDGEKGAGQFGIKNGQEMGVNQFNSTMNTALGKVRNSSSEGIVSGIGGSVKLTGFYRDGLEEFGATSTERYEDDENMTDVKFYMLQNELSPFNRPARTWSDAAKADEIDGIKNVLSPEVSKFKLSTTRPTITTDVATSFDFDPDTDADKFNDLLGMNSIKVEDTGVTNFADAEGKPQSIAVDHDNLRVRVKESGSDDDWSEPKTLAQLKTAMSGYAGKTMDIVYVYSATDAKATNVGLLPSEIANNTGAYAIPLLKQVKVAEEKTVTVKYVLEGDEDGTALYEDTVIGKVGEEFVHTADDEFEKDGVEYKRITNPATVETTFKEEPQTFIFVYKKINYSEITVDYVIKGKETETPMFSDSVTGREGTTFEHTAPSTYEYEGDKYKLITSPNNIDTKYTDENQEFQFVYKKISDSNITVEYVVQGQETETPFFTDTKTDKEDAVFTHEAPLTYDLDGVVYELVTTPNVIDTLYTDANQTFQFVYKKRVVDETTEKGKVITRYVDEDGNVLYTGDEKEGLIGDEYHTISPEVYEKDGVKYERITTPENNTGIYKEGTITVDYIYRAYGEVKATYKTADGTELKDAEILNGTIDSIYNTTKYDTLTVAGKTYKLVATPENSSGKFTKGPITVEYVYELQKDPIPETLNGKVIVRYVDENGKVLEKLEPKVGKVATDYTTTAPATIKIDGVEYTKVATKIPANAKGLYTEKDIYVDYVYKKKPSTDVEPTITEGRVIVRYLDSNGKVLKTLEPKTGEVKTKYLTIAPNKLSVKDVDYERVISKDPKNASGTYTEDDIYVDYIFKEKVIDEDGGNNGGTNTGKTDPNIEPDDDKGTGTKTTDKDTTTGKETGTTNLVTTTDDGKNGNDGKNGEDGTMYETLTTSSTPYSTIPSVTSTTTPTESANNTSTTTETNKSTVNEEAGTVSKSLPQTGTDETIDKLLVILGLLLMGASVIIVGRNKKKHL